MKTSARRYPHTRTAPPPLRRSALAALIAASFGAAHANPTLPQVLNGQATFTQDGKLFSITNTPNTIINWHSFSIGAGEITRFVQQSASSAVLNRITGQDPSAILGSLQSNGKVFLINPNGILFGANARVDVNGLVASSLNLSNQDFLAGAMHFTDNGQAGNVANQGAIHAADGGQVLLIAPNVENTGLITAPNGDVLLAAGHSVQLADAANPALRFVVAAGGQSLNVGQVIAQGGRIGMAGAVVRQRGVLNADSAQVGPGGAIVLRASGQTLIEAGSVTSARAAGGNGGNITVLGDQVGLLGDARVDASGATGGGMVLLGGDYQGRNPAVPNARQVAIESGVTIAADAIDSGNGGKVIAWGDQTARVFGSISARGGAAGGNGGLVETSGHYLDVKGLRVDTGARRGQRGTWLLDPYDITVVAGSGGSLAAVDNFDDAPATGVTEIGAALISGAGSDVLLQATHNITFGSAIDIATPGVGLAATAGASIAVNAPIGTNGGAITLSANDVTSGHAYGGGSNVLLNAALASRGGAVSVSGDSIVGGGAIDTGSGNLALRAIGAVTSSDNEAADGLVTLGGALTVGGDLRLSAASTLRSTGAVSVGGMFRLEGGNWIQNTASLPAFSAHDFAVTGGSFLRAAGGDGATSPYRIVDTYGLQGMSRHNEQLNFTLANNIDASGTISWNTGDGFKSIYGGDGYGWQGNFDGAGFAISGLVINDSGLFRSLDGGAVGNLTLSGGSVHGGVYVGAVTGLNAGTIANVHSSMNVNGDQTSGGLVGYNAGLITGSSSSGNVSLTGNTAGGLVGYNDGTARITLSSASGNVTALGNSAGGLVGTNSNSGDHSGSITSSFATGSVSAASNVGGLVGTNFGMVSRAYATGAVRLADGAMDLAHVNMGGLIGSSNGGIATEIFSTGQVIGTGFDASTVGGLVGSSTVSALEGGYWDIGTSGQAGDNGGGAGLTHAQMLQPASFIGFDFTNTWRIYAGQTTPLIKALLTPVTVTATAATTKVYDGQLATFGGTLGYAGLLAGDTGVDGSAGYGMALNVGTYALGGLYSTRYDITLAGNTQLAITPRVLTATIAGSKVYDSTTSLNGAAFSLSNVVEGDVLTATGTAQFADKNAGTGKTVTSNNVALAGNTFGNYTLSSSASGTGDIARATLTLASVGANNKVYDGTASATLMTSLGGVLGTDQVAVTNPAAAFTDKRAGTGKTVNYSVVSTNLGGTDAANYEIAASGAVTADIALRTLYVGYTTADKVYDGTTAASVTLSDTRIAGDVLAVTASANFDSKNAGTNAVYLSGAAATGLDAANYNVLGPDYIAFATITPRALTATVSGSKVYDGGVVLSGATFALANVVAGDTVSASGAASFADKNAATGKTLSATGISLAGDASANYTVTGTAGGTGAITPRALYVGYTPSGKGYDGTTAASATLSDTRIAGDVLAVTGTATFDSKNAGTNAVYLSGISATGLDAANYSVFGPDYIAFATITPRALTATVSGSKVYDGGAGLSGATFTLANVVAGDPVTASGAASFADKNAATGKALSASGISLAGDASANYTVAGTASGTGAITRASLALGSVSAANKVYDGGTGATVSAVLGGVIGTDQVSLAAPVGSFGDKNVGAAKAVNYTVTDASLSGADAANYQLSASGSTTAAITARALNIGYTANGKVYDATTAATVALSDDRIAGDVLSIAANASFADKNVGTRAVSLSNVALQGADAGNYNVVLPASTAQATITPAMLAAAVTANNKVYDATTGATVVATLGGVLGADQVGVANASGSFADKNVGAAKAVSYTVALNGADAGNYQLAANGTTTADISARALNIGYTANGKVYDATTVATVALSDDRIAGDALSVSASASFADKNAGTKTVSLSNVALQGADAGNYSVVLPASTVQATITPAMLAATVTANNKVYDATTGASLAATLGGVLGADQVGVSSTSGSFTDKNVGAAKTVNYTVALNGIDAGNYQLAASGTITAAITARALNIGYTADGKVYDATTNATVALSDDRIAGDLLTVAASASFADKNAGTKTVALSNVALQGTDAANYGVVLPASTVQATITPATLAATVTANNKVYDATSAATVSAVLGGVLGADQVGVSGASGSFADKNVGAAKTVNYTVALNGADAGNYQLAASGTTTADITARALNIGYTANGKVYDATTNATVALSDDRIAGDLFTVAASASFADKNAGTKTVALSNVALQGTDAANYSVVLPASTAQATITPATLAATVTANNKVYDATTGASLAATLGGVLGADQVAISSTSGSFTDKNVGAAKTVNYTVALNGVDAGNYQLAANGTTTADITARALNIGYTANGKVYDATTNATVALSDDRIAGDAVSIAASASFADKNAGTKAVSLSNVALQGADAGNYTVVLPAAPTQATITPAALALGSVTAGDKVYDGTRTASVGATVTGVLGQDAVSVAGGSGTFADSNHGTGKTVVATGFGLAGADAGNYTLASTGGVAQASIAQKALATWIGAGNGLWSDAANWDGGVVPLADNVLAATIANATGTIGYTAAAGSTVLQSLTSSAGLAVSGGSLALGRATLAGLAFTGGAVQVNGALATTSYAQSAGTLAGAGSLTVGSSFSQAGGAIALGGDVALTQLAGDLRVASLSGAAVSLNAAGAIGQSGAISATSLVTRSQSGTVLDNSGNRVASFTATNSGSGGIALTNATAPGQLVLGSLVTGSGNIAIDNTGGIESHAIAANGGNVSLVAHSPVNVLGAITGNIVTVQASTGVALADGASIDALRDVAITAGSDLTLDGSALKAGNRVALTAGDSLLLKGAATLEVPATGSMALLAQRGSIVAGTDVRIDSHGAPVSLSAPNGTVTAPAGVFVGATLAGVSTGGVPLATPPVEAPVLNYASTVSQQYNPLNLISSVQEAATPLVSIAPVAATPLEEKLTGSTDVKKMYCN